jgi:GNAT superfamily N-acetyltransferase
MMPAGAACSVRRGTAADAGGILVCLQAAFEPYRDRYTPDAFRDTVLTPVTIQLRLATMAVFVAVTAPGEIVGTVGGSAISAEEGHIRGMAVLPPWQGGGLARQLLQAVESELRAQGCQRITLDTTQPLERAMRFYEKHGYRRSGKVSDFFGMPLFEYAKPLQT